MLVRGLKVLINMSLFTSVPNHLKTQKMCSKAVRMETHSLEIVPYYFNTQEMCNKAVRIESYTLKHVPDHLETQQMCSKAVHIRPAPFFCYQPL